MARYDLVVVGGGTGGLVSALIAASVGARVALVERERTGGDCLWTGCVPSKALIAAAGAAHAMRHADRVGLRAVEPEIDFAAVMAHVHGAIERIAPVDSPERLRSEGVDVIEAQARFERPGVLLAGDRRLAYRSAIIATGSSPELPAIPGLAAARPLTSESVWDLAELPGRLAILGGGPIGCELGQAFARLGSAVDLIESGDRLLAKEEPRASALVEAALREDGVRVHLRARAEAVAEDGTALRLADGSTIAFDRLMVATGRRPVTDGLGLERLGVRTDERGAIEVDGALRTTARHHYAVGDVTGGLPFTHVAAHHARSAVPNALFGLRRTADHTAVPWATFTDPEIGRVGPTEDEARHDRGAVTVAEFDFADSDRGITAGRAHGFVKLVGDRRGRLLGATVAAPHGGELIAELAAWVAQGAKIGAVSEQVHAYPTLSEGAARAADGHLRRQLLGSPLRPAARPVLAALRAATSIRRALS